MSSGGLCNRAELFSDMMSGPASEHGTYGGRGAGDDLEGKEAWSTSSVDAGLSGGRLDGRRAKMVELG